MKPDTGTAQIMSNEIVGNYTIAMAVHSNKNLILRKSFK